MTGGMAPRRKGADAERTLVNYLRLHGYPDARRRLAGDGRQGGDIDAGPHDPLEVKAAERPALHAWLEQVGPGGLVVARLRGVTDPGEWAAIQRLSDWLEGR